MEQNSRITKRDRITVFEKYGGKCAYCGCELKKGWHVDHIEPIVRDLKDKSKCEHPEREILENYNPSCPSCNIIKNSMSIEAFRQNIETMLNSLKNYSTQYKFCSKYELVVETGKGVKFYFETV
jgi:5-methylcytosine-specific restriction endonuclease McrA